MITIGQRLLYLLNGIDRTKAERTDPEAQEYFERMAGKELWNIGDKDLELFLRIAMPDHVICYCEPDRETKKIRIKQGKIWKNKK